MSTLSGPPIHLLSLTLKVHQLARDKSRNNRINSSEALLHAHWKRQLVGTTFIQSNDAKTHIHIENSNDIPSFVVTGLTPKTKMKKPEGLFVILPSTRITLQKQKEPTSDKTIDQRNNSVATQLLVDTIECVAKQIPVPRAFLLSGPPGVGKTFSVKSAIAQISSVQSELLSLRGSELLHQHENPAKALQKEFQKAWSSNDSVVVIFLDECDALVSVDSMAAMLASLLDEVSSLRHRVVVVGATNRIESIPNMLRRAGRFDCEIPLSPPNACQRAEILSNFLFPETNTGNDKETTKEIMRIAELCVGYVPADLAALFRRSKYLAMQNNSKKKEKIDNATALNYLELAMNDVVASALRDASLSAPPKTTWDDIAGDPGFSKTLLRQAIEWPRLKKESFKQLGLNPPRGILLHGPPGCSKTTLARAAAGASGVAFFSLSPAQVYASSYVGEAEAVVRRAFTLARAAAPCILFFDECDSIFGDGDQARGSSAEARVLSTFLNEMDGVDNKPDDVGVLVLGATNRPWTLDAALLRPGRLGDKIVYVPPPDMKSRKTILQMQFPDENNFDWDMLAGSKSEGMTGAELIGACQSAKMRLLRDMLSGDRESSLHEMKQEYVEEALDAITPLLSNPRALEEFRMFENNFQR